MPVTYKLIASSTLSTTTASVTFSAIPALYTDIVFLVAARTNGSNAGGYFRFTCNNDPGGKSVTYLERDNANVVASFRDTINYVWGGTSGNGATNNTFGSAELYIPDYLGTTKKQSFAFGLGESNAANGPRMAISANLTPLTTAITSVTLTGVDGSFLTGSSFFLYGIKNT
jgi:hypothetical protein